MEAEIVLRAQELQRVNEQLRASEERYRALLQASPQAAWHMRANGQMQATPNCDMEEHGSSEEQRGE